MSNQRARQNALHMLLDMMGDDNLPEDVLQFRRMNPYTERDEDEDGEEDQGVEEVSSASG